MELDISRGVVLGISELARACPSLNSSQAESDVSMASDTTSDDEFLMVGATGGETVNVKLE
jgi:hypothetical protein